MKNSLDSSVIPKGSVGAERHCRDVALQRLRLATAFGIVADSETLRHDEAPNLSLQIRKH